MNAVLFPDGGKLVPGPSLQLCYLTDTLVPAKAVVSHALDDVLGHLLGVAEQHHGVVAVEQGIVDAGIA